MAHFASLKMSINIKFKNDYEENFHIFDIFVVLLYLFIHNLFIFSQYFLYNYLSHCIFNDLFIYL